MEKLWIFDWMYNIYGLFRATDERVKTLIGKRMDLGGGRRGEIEPEDIILMSDDPYIVANVCPFGINPFDYYEW